MNVIAKQGEQRWLLDVGGGQGRVLDLEQGKLFPPMLIEAITGRGYWLEAVMAPERLAGLVKQVEDVKAETP